MAVQNVEYLREHGPSPVSELPGGGVRLADRGTELQRFTLSTAGATATAGNVRTVAYLERHDRERVLRTFLELNPGFIENRTFRAFQMFLSRKTTGWTDASRAIRDEFFETDEIVTPDTEAFDEDDCPRCGETLPFGQIPRHIANECDAPN